MWTQQVEMQLFTYKVDFSFVYLGLGGIRVLQNTFQSPSLGFETKAGNIKPKEESVRYSQLAVIGEAYSFPLGLIN